MSEENGSNASTPADELGDKTGEEYRVIRVDLDEQERENRKLRIATAHDRKREIEAGFTAFRRWAEPRIRVATDPTYKAPKTMKDEPALSLEEAVGLEHELAHRRAIKSSTVSAIKAEIKLLKHTAAVGCEYQRIECEVFRHKDKPEVIYVSKETGEEVDRRGAKGHELQESIPGTGGKRRRKKSNGAPDVVV